MARHIAKIAHRVVGALTGQVSWLAAIVAGLVIGAVSCDMTWSVTVVAEPGIEGGQPRTRAITRQVTCLVTVVADWLIAAFIGHVPRLLAVPAQSLRSALSCNMPWETTVVTNSYIWTISRKMPRSLAVLAQNILPKDTTALSRISSVWCITVRRPLALTAEPASSRRAPAAVRTHTSNPK